VARFPEAKIVQRDLAKDKIPHMDYSTPKAISSKDPVEVQANNESARLSDQLTDELLASDLLVIANPMWNFGIPSLLKAWIDLVVRAGRTFNYAENGVVGPAKNKKARLTACAAEAFSHDEMN
jgi:FMN-dependent NADH-azoreductase